ncbi:hypothetical protein [Aeromicrobium sp.]|uniref:hypothetical protein n=1 Tax=Aeromicrobium sp. TaxID=1871063 RepID=UPI0019CB7823|nr:hypothetical protein [Aeromicrobium sp.]MBC7631212.1 hypothetical protein [Aeromicrobium sp.]
MSRHPIRWNSLLFGLLFLAVLGNWMVRTQDLLTTRQLSLTVSGVLILLGLAGVAATILKARPARPHAPPERKTSTSTPTPEGHHDEAADSKP